MLRSSHQSVSRTNFFLRQSPCAPICLGIGYVDQGGLMSQMSSCLWLVTAGNKGVNHYSWHKNYFAQSAATHSLPSRHQPMIVVTMTEGETLLSSLVVEDRDSSSPYSCQLVPRLDNISGITLVQRHLLLSRPGQQWTCSGVVSGGACSKEHYLCIQGSWGFTWYEKGGHWGTIFQGNNVFWDSRAETYHFAGGYDT